MLVRMVIMIVIVGVSHIYRRAEGMLVNGLLAWRRFDLDGTVMNVEFAGDELANPDQKCFHIGNVGLTHDVSGQTCFSTRDGPDVQVMHAGHPGNAHDRFVYLRETKAFGHAFQQDVDAGLEQRPGARQDP